MENLAFPTTAAHLSQWFGAEIVGDQASPVDRLSSLEAAGTGSLAYFANRKYAQVLQRINGAVVFTTRELVEPKLPLTYLVVDNPQSAFAAIARQFSRRALPAGVSPQAIVHPTARLGDGVAIGPFACVGEGTVIGAGTQVYPYVFIGNGVTIGSHCEIHPRATLFDRVRLEDRVKVFTGTVIGSEGFGIFGDGTGKLDEMPQIGTVVLESDVRIGANCTIDRGTLGETRVGRGCKVDDQVHIGHNCVVGPNSILCAQVGLGGSVVLEEDVVLAGQVGIGHGVRIGKGARMGGQSGSTTNVRGGETYFATPATPIKEFARILKYWRRLPELSARLKALEAKLDGKHAD
jgi:UDP-3-O-[3-hydroxymyristoyl] glucosamine N-acyltransferase